MHRPPSPIEATLIVVALYARYSRNPDDKSESTKTQIKNGTVKAQEWWPGCEVVVFSDDNRSGGDEDRPGYQEMLRAIRTGRITRVMAKTQSRVARDSGIFDRFRDVCLDAGIIDLHTWGDGIIGMSPGKALTGRLKAVIDDDYREVVSGNVIDSLATYASEGRAPGGVCFGYGRGEVVVDINGVQTKVKTLIPNDQALIVRGIFEDVLNGRPMSRIAAELNDKKVPTPRGGDEWRPSNIRRLLVSPTLTALRVRIPEKTRQSLRAEGISLFTLDVAKKHGTVVEGLWEPIIERDQFMAVQRLLTRPSMVIRSNGVLSPRGIQRDAPVKYLLSHIGVCGLCGTTLSGTRRTGGRASMYVCHSTRGGCDRIGANMLGVDQEAERQFLLELNSEEYRALLKKGDLHGDDRTRIDDGLRDVERRRELDAADEEAGEISRKTFNVKARRLDEREAELLAELAALPERVGTIDPDAILEGWAFNTVEERRTILKLTRAVVRVGPAAKRGNCFDRSRVTVVLGES